MIPQTPPRTHKEALQDMGSHILLLSDLTALLAMEVEELALAILPDSSDRKRLIAACRKKPLWDVALDDYAQSDDAPATARLLTNALSSAAAIAREVRELKALRQEPFKSTPQAA